MAHLQRKLTIVTVKTSAPCQRCGTPTKSMYGYCQRSPECRRLYNREQAKQYVGSEERREYRRRWHIANRERTLAVNKRWAAANSERKRETEAQWRAAHPDYMRQWRTRPGRRCGRKGCNELAAKGLIYCRPHDNESSRRRRQRAQDRTAQFLYDCQGGVCPDADHGGCGQPLGSPAACHIDHLIPAALGGPDEDWNLQLLHGWCNRVKQHRIVPAARALMEGHPDG
jgi:hypothetical protein